MNDNQNMTSQDNYGDGKSIIEILNIGFEPLLTEEEYKLFLEIKNLKNDKFDKECAKNYIELKQELIVKEIDDNFDEDINIDDIKNNDIYYKWLEKHRLYMETRILVLKRLITQKNKEFKNMLEKNINITREIIDNREWTHEDQFRNINIFESDLTRSFGCKDMEHCDDIISVVTYYTEIFNSIMHNGFNYKNKHFVFFTAGAGQTRNKKSTFTSEEKLTENFNKFFCGLTREEINNQGGMNTNKYLAYTSLCQSNTSIWKDFDIDRAIVVPDIEYSIHNQKVRHIYAETPDDKKEIERLQNELNDIVLKLKEIKEQKKSYSKGHRRTKNEVQTAIDLKNKKNDIQEEINYIRSKYHKTEIKKMDVTIPFTDGFGITFKREPNAMIRLPFVKGLLSYISKNKFISYCKSNNIKIDKVIDIYGVSHNINDVDYLFTESQFKMHKYYQNIYDNNGDMIKSGWDVYRENFKKYGCTANRCNIEKKVKLNAKTNYQVLQTLTTEMTDEEIKGLAEYDFNNLNGIGKDLQCMLNILGANEEKNDKLNYFQKSLIFYPEMFKDYYVKTLLKNTKDSMIKKIKSGKFNINGTYTFIIPEPLACLQWWFTGERDFNKLGLLRKGQVHCRLFNDDEELDCLRSPHLDHTHCIRENVNNKEINSWYKSSGLYVGVDDIMSKLLMYDNDGDISLVHNNKIIIDCAKRFQEKYQMIPNYYDMPKANPQLLNNDSLFNGIVMAYHHGNIGTPSNEITKIFDTLNPNSTEDEVREAIEIIALRVMDVNYTIDYAKTLYKPFIPKDILSRYKKFSGRKVPRFFEYAKDKKIDQVEEITNNNINRISNLIKNTKIVFNDANVLGEAKYSYKTLMNDPNIKYTKEEANKILSLYRELEQAKLRMLRRMDFESFDIKEKQKIKMFLEKDSIKQRDNFVEMIGKPKEFITDVLIKLLQDDANKDTLWKLFGDVIYNNLQNNLKNTKRCEVCGVRFEYNHNCKTKPKYCNECAEKIIKKQKALWIREKRKK